jgi:hypothetical protein
VCAWELSGLDKSQAFGLGVAAVINRVELIHFGTDSKTGSDRQRRVPVIHSHHLTRNCVCQPVSHVSTFPLFCVVRRAVVASLSRGIPKIYRNNCPIFAHSVCTTSSPYLPVQDQPTAPCVTTLNNETALKLISYTRLFLTHR